MSGAWRPEPPPGRLDVGHLDKGRPDKGRLETGRLDTGRADAGLRIVGPSPPPRGEPDAPPGASPGASPGTSLGPRRPIGVAFTRLRRAPNVRWLARRRRTIRLAKLVLPSIALVLLTALALWPQIAGDHTAARLDFRTLAQVAQGDTVFGARYHGMDQQNRPYTVTAAVAQRIGPDRVNLREPQGDLLMHSGGAIILEAQRGVYWRAARALDLSRNVTLSRDDGTTLITASAAIDLKRGAAAGAAPVDATGPFGTLHANRGFTLLDKGADIEFIGPARLVLSGVTK